MFFPRFLGQPLLVCTLSAGLTCAMVGPASADSQLPPHSAAPQTAVADGQPRQIILSMRAAIASAISKNIDLRIEAQNSKMASTELSKSYAIYNPLFTASGNGGKTAVPGEAFFSSKNLTTNIGLSQSLPTGGSVSAATQSGYFRFEPSTTASKEWQATAGIALTQPLLRNAGKESFEMNIYMAESMHQDSLERFRSTTNETVSSVIIAYNRLYVLRQVRDTREAAMVSAQTLLEGIRKKEASPTQQLEIANAEFAISQRRKDFIEASRSVTDQETNLRYLIGLEDPLKIVPSDPPSREEPHETDEQAVAAALELRPDLRQLKNGLQTAQLQERVAWNQALPELSINASGGLTGTGYNFSESYRQLGNTPGTYWTAGMTFSVPLGNTSGRNEYIKNKIRVEQAQEQIKALSWKIRNEVETDMRALISARLQIQLTEKSTHFAEQRLDQYRKNNLLKMSTIQDILNAENDLNIARNSELEAVETFSNAVTKLWKDSGLLLDYQGIHINKSRIDNNTGDRLFGPSLLIDSLAAPRAETTAASAPNTVQENVTTSNTANTGPDEKSAEKPASATRIVPILPAPPSNGKTFTLALGEFSSKALMAEAIAKIEHVGLVSQVKQAPARQEQMIRLNVGTFASNLQARNMLKKLQLHKAHGFTTIDDKQRYVVYAGSFLDQSTAIKEQARLAGYGVKVRTEKATVTLQTYQLFAGSFLGREVALNYARKLEQLGIKPVITELP